MFALDRSELNTTEQFVSFIAPFSTFIGDSALPLLSSFKKFTSIHRLGNERIGRS